MVERQIAARGILDPRVLEAMRTVPRHRFVEERFAEFAYQDTPLPIGEGQTISQPYIVALMAEALSLKETDRVLEVGAGSGYAAAVLSHLAREVLTVERWPELAERAARVLRELGCDNVRVEVANGSLGWPSEAPFDAIVSTAAGPRVPEPLIEQLSPEGGRLVIPVGDREGQILTRITRRGDALHRENLGDVRFVPLIGAHAWAPPSGVDADPGPAGPPWQKRLTVRRTSRASLPELIAACAEPIDDVDTSDLSPLIDRIGEARVVLLGESTHGTSEFYRLRARITKELVERRGFEAVALEADWPDAARLDRWVRGRELETETLRPFTRFPTWMWRNEEFEGLTRWLRSFNERTSVGAGLYGLDLYSLFRSMAEVVRYLDRVDPRLADRARERFACLSPWQADPAAYGRATLLEGYASCADEVARVLTDLLESDLAEAAKDAASPDDFIDAVQNAKVVQSAEAYYRAMYLGSRESWNLRDRHMLSTLQIIRAARGATAKIVVWAHNSHVGDARATELGARGELNLGQLCREELGEPVHIVGFGTHRGTVLAASQWEGPHEVKDVRPSHSESYERLGHDAGIPAFCLDLRGPREPSLKERLRAPRLERAIGVIYRPESELASHYFHAALPDQFDDWLFIDETSAVTERRAPSSEPTGKSVPETFPFGL